MRPLTAFIREPRDRVLPRDVLVAEPRYNHRPSRRYTLRLGGYADMEAARAAGIPVFAVTASMVTMLGYPMHFPPIVVVPSGCRDAVQTDLPVIRFLSEAAVKEPRLEDIAVALLRFDVLAARAVIERNRDLFDPAYLVKRIYQEDLEAEASHVRLQDFLPILTEGQPLPRRALERATASNRPRGVIP